MIRIVDTGCKMPDCGVIASAVNRGATVATFDERLRTHTRRG
jgi:hypothetical protein